MEHMEQQLIHLLAGNLAPSRREHILEEELSYFLGEGDLAYWEQEIGRNWEDYQPQLPSQVDKWVWEVRETEHPFWYSIQGLYTSITNLAIYLLLTGLIPWPKDLEEWESTTKRQIGITYILLYMEP